MKNIFIILALVFSFTSCKKESNEYTINAKIDGVPDGKKVELKYIVDNRPVLLDSALIENGSFTFKGSLSEPDIHLILIESIRGSLPFILENAELEMELYKDSLGLSKIIGSKDNDVAQSYMKSMSKFRKRNDALMIQLNQARQTNDTIFLKEFRNKSQQIQNESKKFNIDFLKEDNNSLFALLLLENLVKTKSINANEINEYFSSFSSELQNSKVGKRIEDILNKTLATEIGAIAPDFTAPDPDGKQISLNEIKGKVTIIDFWAAWCGPCRKENPNVVKLYEKYHDKGLEIIGVSLDGNSRQKDPKKAWLDAIEKDGLKWHQVSNLNYFRGPVAKQYNIQAIPATFILDSEGKIIAKNLRGPALEQKISELLN